MRNSIFPIAIICIFICFIFYSNADVCNQITSNVEITTPLDGISLYNWTGSFTINQTADGHRIYLTKGSNSSADPVNIYANESIGADYDWRKWGDCTIDNVTGGCYWFTKAGEFSPYLEFTTGFETLLNLYVAHTYVDEGYFGETYGMVFTNDNNDYYYSVNYGDYRAQYHVICENFIPVPPVTIPSKTCTIFSLDAVVYDITQNYKISTSVSAIVNVSNGIGFITGIAKGPDDLISGIYMNVDGEALQLYEPMNDRHNQSISVLPDTDRYVFSWWQQQLDLYPDGVEFGTGKLILRNGISYFEEGKPYTENNDCLFNSATLSDKYVGTSSFCCDVFSDVKPVGGKNNFVRTSQKSLKDRKSPRSQNVHPQTFRRRH